MALINLKLIEELETESMDAMHMAQAHAFGWSKLGELGSEGFAAYMKTYFQAQNLYRQLRSVHQICSDFLAGNFQQYILEAAASDESFDPFWNLGYPFEAEGFGLPPRIEQYSHLMSLALGFSRSKQVFRESFGIQNIDVDIDPERIIVELSEIEVDYCLDGYNEFHWRCLDLIQSYQQTGDAQACAAEILSLFKN